MITITGTRDQITAISDLPAVRSIYGVRTLNLNSEPEVRAVTGVDRAWRDAEIAISNHNLPVTGQKRDRCCARHGRGWQPWRPRGTRGKKYQTGRNTKRQRRFQLSN